MVSECSVAPNILYIPKYCSRSTSCVGMDAIQQKYAHIPDDTASHQWIRSQPISDSALLLNTTPFVT